VLNTSNLNIFSDYGLIELLKIELAASIIQF